MDREDKVNNNADNKVESNSRERKRIKLPSRYKDYELWIAFDAVGFVDELPQGFNDLTNWDDTEMWENAMYRELKSIQENNTWEVVDKPNNSNLLHTRWVYGFKEFEECLNDKYKARLVVRGFAQDG